MSTLLTNIGNIITSLINWMGSVATALIENKIFQIMLAVVILILFFGIIKNIVIDIKLNKWYRYDYNRWKEYMESKKVKKE